MVLRSQVAFGFPGGIDTAAGGTTAVRFSFLDQRPIPNPPRWAGSRDHCGPRDARDALRRARRRERLLGQLDLSSGATNPSYFDYQPSWGKAK